MLFRLVFCLSFIMLFSACHKPVRWSFFDNKNSSSQTEKVDGSVFSGTGEEVKYDDNFTKVQNTKNDKNTFPVVDGLASKNKYSNEVKSSSNDKKIEQMVNNSFENTHVSALSQKEGQIDLNSGWKVDNKKTNKNTNLSKNSNFNSQKQIENKSKNEFIDINKDYNKEIKRLDREIAELKKKENNSGDCNSCSGKKENTIKQLVAKPQYRIQCGNFADEGRAKYVVKKLESKGLKGDIIVENGYHKVFVGNFKEKDYASDIWKKMEEVGIDDAFFVYR